MHDPVGSVPVLQNLEATNEPSGVCVCINREFAAADSAHPSNDDEYHPDINGHAFCHDIDIFFLSFLIFQLCYIQYKWQKMKPTRKCEKLQYISNPLEAGPKREQISIDVMLKYPFSQHKFICLQFGPMDFYCNLQYVPHA